MVKYQLRERMKVSVSVITHSLWWKVFSLFSSSSYVNQSEVVSYTEYEAVMFLDSKWVPSSWVETDDVHKKLCIVNKCFALYLFYLIKIFWHRKNLYTEKYICNTKNIFIKTQYIIRRSLAFIDFHCMNM